MGGEGRRDRREGGKEREGLTGRERKRKSRIDRIGEKDREKGKRRGGRGGGKGRCWKGWWRVMEVGWKETRLEVEGGGKIEDKGGEKRKEG